MIRIASICQVESGLNASELAERWTAAGFEGADLNGGAVDETLSLGRALNQLKIELACVGGAVTLPPKLGADTRWLDPARSWVMAAAQLDCPLVRLALLRGTGAVHRPYLPRLTDQLRSLSELAAQHAVLVLLDNAPPFATARQMWDLLEQCPQNCLACAWHAKFAVEARESSAVSVSVLNSRIRHVVLNSVDAPQFGAALDRLRGVGFAGWVGLATEPGSEGAAIAELKTRLTPRKGLVTK